MKTIVTHLTPDLDAISSVWLLKRFFPNWEDATIAFVPSGKTLNDMEPDSDRDILHVDTGLGMLDHHQTPELTCAAKKTFEYILGKKTQFKHHEVTREALERMVAFIVDVDHFREIKYPGAHKDYFLFMATSILDGWKRMYYGNDSKVVELGMEMLDAVLRSFMDRVWAERDLEEHGVFFQSKWGKAVGIESMNDEVLRHAMRQGYLLAVRKDPEKKYVRIKGLPGSKVDLTTMYEKLKKKDPDATWFLHISKKMLLNGTTHNPDMRPTKLSLEEIIAVFKK